MENSMIWLFVFVFLAILAGIGQFVVNLRKRRMRHGQES